MKLKLFRFIKANLTNFTHKILKIKEKKCKILFSVK